jgi:hypothetical protein
MTSEPATCYTCDAPATSTEHVPPKCLFPETKDTGGVDYRQQLITVPSCDQHNTGKSKDDEYLLVMLAMHFENNEVAAEHCRTKIKRALEHSEGLYKYFAERAKKVSDPTGAVAVAVHVEMDRFVPALCNIVRAIYFADTGKKLLRPLQVFTLALRGPDVALWQRVEHLLSVYREMITPIPPKGANPAVFQYQILHQFNPYLVVIRLLFYQSFEVIGIAGDKIEGEAVPSSSASASAI